MFEPTNRGFEDLFGKHISDGTTSAINIPSSNEYNPERFRLEVDGTPVQPEYGSVSQYNHTGRRHELKPNAGETVFLRSAERPRYAVQYELAVSLAFKANKTNLSGDDRIRCGHFDGNDGWCMEFNSGHSGKVADLVTLNAGSIVERKQDVPTYVALDVLRRSLIRTAWYDVSRNKWNVSYALNGYQINREMGRTGNRGQDGPSTPNLPVGFEVRADSGTSDLVLEAGSFAVITYGPPASVNRTKEISLDANIGTTGDWVPLYAFRVDPSRTDINVQVVATHILQWAGSAKVEIQAQSFASQNVTFTGSDSWSTPGNWSPSNNVMQLRTDVDQIVDGSGSSQDTTSDPGGFQLNYDVLGSQNNFFSEQKSVGSNFREKANITEDRVVVVIARGAETGDIETYHQFAQDF
jgi:hypothetical protein